MTDAADPYAAALEATMRGLQREIARLRGEVDDQRGMVRGYRRLFIEALRRSKDCPWCNDSHNSSRQDQP